MTDSRYKWENSDLTEQTALHPYAKSQAEGVHLRLTFSRD